MSELQKDPYALIQMQFLFVGCILVLMMVPGLGYLYTGLTRATNTRKMIASSILVSTVGSLQWYFWGYSLSFSSTSNNKFIGDLHNIVYYNMFSGFTNSIESNIQNYTELPFSIFQGLFMIVTIAILSGCVNERTNYLPFSIFIFCWCTVVYCPCCYWIWNSNGWAYQWGVLDYAGGFIEITSGLCGFIYPIFVFKKKQKHEILISQRASISNVTMGMMFLCIGWLGFNTCTTVDPSDRSFVAFMNTILSGLACFITWSALEIFTEGQCTYVGVCSGIICGLVAATPSSGMIQFWASLIQGVVTAVCCFHAAKFKFLVGIDDSMDILAEHFVAGVIGLLFNGLFANDWIIALDGVTAHPGGWVNQNYIQLAKQIAYIAAVTGYAGVVTIVLLFVIDKIPGCQLFTDYYMNENDMDDEENNLNETDSDLIRNASSDKIIDSVELSNLDNSNSSSMPDVLVMKTRQDHEGLERIKSNYTMHPHQTFTQ